MKLCTGCREMKDNYYKDKRSKDGLRSECKDCLRQRTYKYRKTKAGLIVDTYQNMRRRITDPKHKGYRLYKDLEILNKQDFYSFCEKSTDLEELYKSWDKVTLRSRPSIDRIDPKKGYTLDNMRWITHSENSRLSSEENKYEIYT